MTKSVTCPEELGGLASQVTVDYGQLAHQGRLAAATAEPEEVRSCALRHMWGKLHTLMKDLHAVYIFAIVPLKRQTEISALGLHVTAKKMLLDVSTHTLIRTDVFFLFFDMRPLPQGCPGQCEIKRKVSVCSIRHSQDPQSFLKALLCHPAMCGNIALIHTERSSISCIWQAAGNPAGCHSDIVPLQV